MVAWTHSPTSLMVYTLDPKVMIWQLLQDPRTLHTDTWSLWGTWWVSWQSSLGCLGSPSLGCNSVYENMQIALPKPLLRIPVFKPYVPRIWVMVRFWSLEVTAAPGPAVQRASSATWVSSEPKLTKYSSRPKGVPRAQATGRRHSKKEKGRGYVQASNRESPTSAQLK